MFVCADFNAECCNICELTISPILAKVLYVQTSYGTCHKLFLDIYSSDSKPRNERTVGSPTPRPNLQITSPDVKIDDLDEQLDILNNDDEDAAEAANGSNVFEKEFHTGIDINIPQQNDTDDEIAEIDVSDDDVDKGPNAAEALREQVNAEGRATQTSSSSSSGTGSSGSGSKSSSESGSGSGSSSSDGESSDEVTSI